jgi:hypothetical protein
MTVHVNNPKTDSTRLRLKCSGVWTDSNGLDENAPDRGRQRETNRNDQEAKDRMGTNRWTQSQRTGRLVVDGELAPSDSPSHGEPPNGLTDSADLIVVRIGTQCH